MSKLPYIHSYDVRGIYEKDFSKEVLEKFVLAMVNEYNPKTVVIGYDMRESSPVIFKVFYESFLKLNVKIVSVGLCSTPQLYAATCTSYSGIECDLGIIITASHNPKEYNGFKLCKRYAVPIAYGTGLEEIERRMIENDFTSAFNEDIAHQADDIEEVDIQEEYRSWILEYLSNMKSLTKPIKVAIDYANAIGCYANKPIIMECEKRGFIECVHIFDELDGTFPNHEANPIKQENLVTLKEKVKEHNCDLGISFDGDADRIGFVNAEAEYVEPDVVGAFIVEDYANTKPSDFKAYCYDLRSTNILRDLAQKYNLESKKTRVGHSHIKKDMHDIDAQFSCELAGHFYFEQTGSKYDDALRCLIDVICSLSHKEQSFTELMRYYTPKLKSPEMSFKVEDPLQKVEESKQWFNEFGEYEADYLDGVSYKFNDFWLNIRKSNTEPLLRINFEVTNENQGTYDRIEEIINEKLIN